MGHKRYVTSDMCKDAKVVAVALEWGIAALMWPWFVNALDDWARSTGDLIEIKYSIFQAFEYTPEDIERALALFVKHKLIHRYEANGKPYIQANPKSFYAIQTYIQKSRQKHDSSKLPPPCDHPWGNFWETSDWDGDGQQKAAISAEI